MMLCGGCCQREQPVSVVQSDADGFYQGTEAPSGEARDPFLPSAGGIADDTKTAKAGASYLPDSYLAAEGSAAGASEEAEDRAPVVTPDVPEGKGPADDQDVGSFEMIVERSGPTQALGAVFDASIPAGIYVSSVVPGGLISEGVSRSGQRLQTGDYVMAVNGVSASDAVWELRMASRVVLRVRRPLEFDVNINKGSSLGCSIVYDAHNGSVLGIASLLDGPLKRWNELALAKGNYTEIVQEGDRIVCVNGQRGLTRDLLLAIQSSENLTLRMSRPVPDP